MQAIEKAVATLKAEGYDVHQTATGTRYVTGFESDPEDDTDRLAIAEIVGRYGCTAEWVDDDVHICPPEDELTAIERTDGWCVEDGQGGVWWPSDEAAKKINSATDPGAEAVRMCREQPMRGTWHS